MNEFFYLIIGTFGAIFGSFASALIPRLREKQDFVAARSECPKCHHALGVFDLFPIFSYLFLWGKCRYCKTKIPPYHFLLELGMVVGFLITASLVDISSLALGNGQEWIKLAYLLVSMFVTVVFVAYDLLYLEIPDELMIPFLIISFGLLSYVSATGRSVFDYFVPFENTLLSMPLEQAFLGAIPIFLFFLLQYQISGGTWLGGGDLRIAIFMGFVAGAKMAWLGLFLSYIVGSVVGVAMLVIYRQRGMQVPFGPFLAIGLWMSMLWYEPILRWYLSLVIV